MVLFIHLQNFPLDLAIFFLTFSLLNTESVSIRTHLAQMLQIYLFDIIYKVILQHSQNRQIFLSIKEHSHKV